MAVFSVLVLLALTDAITGLFFKSYIYCIANSSWTDAQTFCKNNHVDLPVINTKLEFDDFNEQTIPFQSDSCWIGLRKKSNEKDFTRWSDGSVLDFSMWGKGQPALSNTDQCVFTKYNRWVVKNCTTTMNFFCYDWAPQMIVVQEMMTWEEALMYCRTQYTDLVSLTTDIDFFLLNKNSADILTPTFWTGLRFMGGSWFYVNQNPVENLASMPSCPARPYWCGARNVNDGVWENRDCEEKMNFICYY